MKTTEKLAHNQRQVGYFEKNHKKTMIPKATPYLDNHIDRLIAAGKIGMDEDIIEVGCGMGRYTLPLLRRGYSVAGLDISPGLLEDMRRHRGDLALPELYCTDISDAQGLIGRLFDTVIGCFTLHHIHDLSDAFAGVAKILKSGGKIAFLEPNPLSPLYYIQATITRNMHWSMERGMVRLRRAAIFRQLEEAGFETLGHQRFGFFPPFVANLKGAVEKHLERLPLITAYLPFQIFTAVKR